MQLSRRELLDAYSSMRMIRAFREDVDSRKNIAPDAGFRLLGEACHVALGLHLQPQDLVCATSADPALLLGAGVSAGELMRQVAGVSDPSKEAAKRQSVMAKLDIGADADAPGFQVYAGSSAAQVLGAAIARRTQAPGAVTVCYLSEEAVEEGRTFDLLCSATTLSLPLLFVLPRRADAAESANEQGRPARPQSPFVKRAESFGVTALAARAWDFFSMHHVAGEAVARARSGNGPTALEAVCSGADPIEMFRQKTRDADIFGMDHLQAADRQVERTLEEARAGVIDPTCALTGARS